MADVAGAGYELPGAYGGELGGWLATGYSLAAGIAVFRRFAMRGRMVAPPYALVHWTTVDQPDFGGTQAPAPVSGASVVCMGTWTE